MRLKSIVRAQLSSVAGIDLRRSRSPAQSYFDALVTVRSRLDDGDESEFLQFCRTHFLRSKGQLFQDLFVLFETSEKRGGFFVEFGATDGINLSNSYLLEADFDWHGILAEPARVWHNDLAANRSALIDNRCVTDQTGETVRFNEAKVAELSTIDSLSSRDQHKISRQDGTRYDVPTVSLNDLLEVHAAPADFDYLSIDTEGSEFDILNALDFARFRPKIITVEHNFVAAKRAQLNSLLTAQGYVRKFESLSQFDDWYVTP